MRITFVENFSINFGLGYLSAALKRQGVEVEVAYHPIPKWKGIDIYKAPERYFDFEAIARDVAESRPDVVAFSVFSANYMFFRRLSPALRAVLPAPIIVGGVLPSMAPTIFTEGGLCDALVRGEAELMIGDLLDALPSGNLGKVPNVVWRTPAGSYVDNGMSSYVADLDLLPHYDRSMFSRDSGALYVLTSRGCSMSCTYCAAGPYSRLISGPASKVVRKRKVGAVIDELKEALAEYPYREVFFYDDFFITTREWLREFVDLYGREIGLPYYCEAFPNTVTRDIAEILGGSGCKNVQMGFQTANDEYKKTVLKRHDTKAQVQKAMANLREFGVSSSLDHIFNLPGETHEHIGEALDFYLDNEVRSLSVFFLNYYPDSAITRHAREAGILSERQYGQILKNEIMGEQSYKGTIVDETLAARQVQYAFLFKLINLFPAAVVRFLFRHRWFRVFPANRWIYYGLSALVELRGRGFAYLRIILELSFARKRRERRPPA